LVPEAFIPQGHKSIVALERVRGDVRSAVGRALRAVDWQRVIPAGADVAIKVNLGWDMFIPGSITSPLAAEALILEIRDHVGRIRMVEANQVLEDVEKSFRESGMAALCERTGVEWVNMSRAPFVRLERPGNSVLRVVEIPALLQESLLITLPVMKTHAKTVITGALKNQWGCLNEMRHEHHLVLDDALADLNSVVRPALALMDGTIGLEGNGPKSGRPRAADLILCSADPVALDTIQAIAMGIDPASVSHLASCAARGIGTNDRAAIEVAGTQPEELNMRFRPARHNAVSAIETLLRASWMKKLVFDTPLFRVCLAGAKCYYKIWTLLHAGAIWKRVRAHPLYGPQWQAGWQGIEAQSR
jgi:uncharacterized protein (DUF362 family)